MALKIISFIFVISIAFGISTTPQVKDVPFDVNEVVNQVSPHRSRNPNSQSLTPSLPGVEFPIDTNIVYSPSLGQEKTPSIAFDGTNYLVVWQDNRDYLNSWEIYGTRVNQSGVVIDKAGFQISLAIYDQINPSVSFNGSNYLVVWEDNRIGNWEIYGTRVNQGGIVLDTNGIAISTAINSQKSPSVASNGLDYFVVWQDQRSGYYDIYGTRVNQDGVVLDPNGIAITNSQYPHYDPSIAFDGTNYLVVWEDQHRGADTSDIYGARIDQYGSVLDPNGFIISAVSRWQISPSLSFDSTNYLVVWEDYRNRNMDIYGARVSQTGIVLDPNGFAISTAIYSQRFPTIAFDGSNYLVVWQDDRNHRYTYDIFGARVNQSGVVLDSNGLELISDTNNQRQPSLAFDGSNYFVVWEDSLSVYHSSSNVYGVRVNQVGVVIDSNSIAISTTANRQDYPSVAFDGANYFIVWTDYRNSDVYPDIYGLRLNQSGRILDSTDIAISTVSYTQWTPSVIFGGINYFVVWSDHRDSLPGVYGARINQYGLLLDTNGIFISSRVVDQWYRGQLATAFDGINYFVAWVDYRNNYYFDIYGARVNQEGVVLDPEGIKISAGTSNEYNPSIAFDGINYLVVWQDARFGGDIYGARVSPEGVVLDSAGIAISNTANYEGEPSVAFDGNNYLVAWSQGRGDTTDIYGARVRQNGTVIDTIGFSISTARYSQFQFIPSIAFNGNNYLVIWQESRLENSNLIFDIYGAKVNTSGVVIDSFPVSIQPKNQSFPTLAKGEGYQILVVYSGWAGVIQGRVYSETRIWGNFSPFGSIDEENSKVKMQSAKLLEIYPNPAKSVMRVRYPWSAGEQTDIKIFDVSGKMIKETEILRSAQNDRGGDTKISLKGISPGIYFLRLGKETKKFLVVK